MPAYKDKKNGSWYLQFRYTDWTGERRPKVKRGFATKREALEWERQFLMQRKADNNMTFERVEGSWNGKAIELEDIAKRTQNGESACLVLKAQDLSQEGLSDRRLLPTKQGLTAMKANHDTTIAGFSYDSKGKIAGIWLNDTGGWAGSNRVFISRDKFMQMQKMTDGFAVEYAKRKV